ncbi:hypothetical protein GCM10009433_06520 [Psychroflexus lacisalsi]|uniref:DUF4381 domain-containing protein n=2 Tax=Psychroflexus lacisalsi TaxID=503928 RepID=A0ABN1K3J7_9FLAO|nr:hypothetical protein [Psychroflexus lacisalsi]MBZ9618791.1 hypothetical protein [Psychroflexus lacisalsi]
MSRKRLFTIDSLTLKSLLIVMLLLVCSISHAQEVSFEADKDTIQIGEQIDYLIKVDEISEEDLVIFPKDQTFVPLEMVEDYKIDTLNPQAKTFTLTKLYKLTQFDSGTYSVPPQLVKINEKAFYTDTLKVRVNDVVLDTTKQKLYPIKPSIGVDKPFALPSWFWWILIALLILAGIAFLVFKLKKKRDEAKRRIPPYEQAMISLKELDKSSVLENRNFKEYISELTYITRRYLEEKLEIRALEFTTNELISELKFKKEKKKLALKEDMILEYEKILKRADLAKFANSRPDLITLKSDRKQIEKFLKQVQSSIPQITEEEKKKDEAFQKALAKKRKKQKWIVGIVLGLLFIIVTVSAVVATKGFEYLRDTVIGNPSKELLKGDWVTSDYGVPPISMTTPDVLIRGELDLPEEILENVANKETYSFGTLYQNIYVTLNKVRFKDSQDIDLDVIVDRIYSNLEERGAYNIITKSEDFETLGGVKGKKVFGSFSIENPITKKDIKKEYKIVNFGRGGFQQVIIFYDRDDEFGEKISNRILNAVEFKNLSQ